MPVDSTHCAKVNHTRGSHRHRCPWRRDRLRSERAMDSREVIAEDDDACAACSETPAERAPLAASAKASRTIRSRDAGRHDASVDQRVPMNPVTPFPADRRAARKFAQLDDYAGGWLRDFLDRRYGRHLRAAIADCWTVKFFPEHGLKRFPTCALLARQRGSRKAPPIHLWRSGSGVSPYEI